VRFASSFVLPAVLALLAGMATGCGGSPLSPTNDGYASITGDWRFSNSAANTSVSAGLVDDAGSVTGTATVTGCSSISEQMDLTGSVSSKGVLTLKTVQLAGGAVLTLRGQLSADGQTASNITLISSGRTCSLPASQTLTGQVYSPATGSYTGTFTGSDGEATPVTAMLSQNVSPGPGGSYTLSGSVAFPSSPCLATASIDSALSTVTGGVLSATYATTVAGQSVTITAAGTSDPSATNVTITNWIIAGGPCDGYSGTGNLVD
jgi:hypothetical protein